MSKSKGTSSKGDKKAAKQAAKAVGPGPIAPWRLSLAVACSGAFTGQALLDAASTGQHLDLALGRSFGAACLVWVAAGKVNRMFIDVERRRIEELTRLEDDLANAAYGDLGDDAFQSSALDDASLGMRSSH